MPKATVAVVGAGPCGLSMLKQLREDGFSVTGFERRERVGGLWAYSEDPSHTTALPRTVANLSKYTCGFSDYPMPERYPIFLRSDQFREYCEDYARHFDTLKDWVFNTSVKKASRNADDTKWCLEVDTKGGQGPQTLEFDKVVFSHGYQTRANIPQFEGQDQFEGLIIHSQQYRKPDAFANKRVIVLGLSSTSADILPDILPHAAHPVYAAHRRGAVPFRRFRKGVPTDALATWRRRQITHSLQAHLPNFARVCGDLAVKLYIRLSYPNLDPEWRLTDIASIALKVPGALAFDSVLPCLRDGSIQSVHGIKRFLGPKKVELLDGMVLDDIDAVIMCTGYSADFSVVGPDALETSLPTAHGYAAAATQSEGGGRGDVEMYRLWMNIFPPKYADSLAMLCYSAFGKSNGFSFADVTSMAVSNVFRGAHPLPSRAEMERWVDEHQAWVASRWKLDHSIDTSMVRQWEYQRWLHDAAGTGMENLSWMGWKGWKFWWKDRKMYNLMANGIESAHMYRYFETGKRRTWDGAREAILKLDEERKRVLPVTPEQEKEFVQDMKG
ncbi:FAD/NAD(P)-binding domain-containing protein [Cryphonectria parasitica EP155]|uniref:FAD/NAD(P)-binding domain-containing protein n=1 Tax=Cryphonectria parasitica (strain ATCC 38755 / EP155) TaxID=660469 RepID=A0A9P5CRZ1_CRYP1|nr:FAD/NAD(P)-binding domain-containing protein [Cryphonectria parasitica EP155]KAF3768753.1 FAD/NAD(P)-binding domain-containing protein [Cryphonectria parasitica EP155]